jgi:hypothetical protein
MLAEAPPKAAAPPAELVSAFVSAKVILDVLSISYPRLKKLAADGVIRVRQVPGGQPRYSLGDALRLLADPTPAAG